MRRVIRISLILLVGILAVLIIRNLIDEYAAKHHPGVTIISDPTQMLPFSGLAIRDTPRATLQRQDLSGFSHPEIVPFQQSKRPLFTSANPQLPHLSAFSSDETTLFVLDSARKMVHTYSLPQIGEFQSFPTETWLGEDILVSFSTGYQNDRVEHFYLLDRASEKFSPLTIDSKLANTMARSSDPDLLILPRPGPGQWIAFGYCVKQGWDHCSRAGFALSDGTTVREILRTRVSPSYYRWEWQGPHLVLREATPNEAVVMYQIDPAAAISAAGT